mgnify:CR=1 FL=1
MLKKQTERPKFDGVIRRTYGGEGAMMRQLQALRKVQKIETIPDKMKTYPRIPFERAIKLRPRASPIEAERFFLLSFEQTLDEWIRTGIKAPSQDDLSGAITDTTLKKLDCIPSALKCRGMNPKVYNGEFENCGKVQPFYLWKRHVDEKDYEEELAIFMDQYKIDPF